MKNLIFIIAFAAVISSSGIHAAEPPADYKGPIAQQPPLTPGDFWAYQWSSAPTKAKWIYQGIENGMLLFQTATVKDRWWTTPKLGTIKKVNGKTGAVTVEMEAPFDDVEFPLYVGKKWDFTFLTRSRDFGIMVPIDVTYTVIGYRPITVAAGTSEAFEISRIWQARGYSDRGENTWWYSPKLKNFIKYEGGASDRELTSYKVQ